MPDIVKKLPSKLGMCEAAFLGEYYVFVSKYFLERQANSTLACSWSVERDDTPKETYAYDANGSRILKNNGDRSLMERILTRCLEGQMITVGVITFEFDTVDYLAARIDASGTR